MCQIWGPRCKRWQPLVLMWKPRRMSGAPICASTATMWVRLALALFSSGIAVDELITERRDLEQEFFSMLEGSG